MIKQLYSPVFFTLFTWVGITGPSLAQESPLPSAKAPLAEAQREFTPDEQAARQQVLNSDGWNKAKAKWDEWLAVQTAYSAEEIAALRTEFQRQIDNMSARELVSFVEQMDQKLTVLLNPETVAARRWVAHFAAPVQERIVKKIGAEDPLQLSPSEMNAAIAEFDAERRARANVSAANSRARQAQVKAINQDIANREKARAASRSSASSFGNSSPYAPRGRSYSPAYTRPRTYGVSPWGGVWISR